MLRMSDPFRDFDRFFARPGGVASEVPMDVIRHEHRLDIYFDLPGVDPDSIDLTVEKGELSLTAERSVSVPEGSRLVVNERTGGTYQRRLFLSETLDTDQLEASYDNGVLVVSVPVAEAAKPRKVSIGASSGGAAIEADATETSSS